MGFEQNAEEYIFFSSAHGTFSRIDHILGDKSSLSKFKKPEIVSGIFYDWNALILDINYRGKKNTEIKNTNSRRFNNKLINKEVTEEVRKEIKRFLETNDNENMTQNLWDSAKAVLRGRFISDTILPQEARKILNRQPSFTPKTTGKRRTKNPQR